MIVKKNRPTLCKFSEEHVKYFGRKEETGALGFVVFMNKNNLTILDLTHERIHRGEHG